MRVASFTWLIAVACHCPHLGEALVGPATFSPVRTSGRSVPTILGGSFDLRAAAPSISKQESKTALSASSLVTAVPSAAKSLFGRTSAAVGGVRLSSVLLSLTALFVLAAATKGKTILYPGAGADKHFDEPLPPGAIDGCPFVGNFAAFGNLNEFLYQRAAGLTGSGAQSPPRIWKFFGFFKPTAVVSGSKAIKKIMNLEFTKGKSNKNGSISQATAFGNIEEVFGKESMSFEVDSKKKYQDVRKLVGQAMTPDAVAKGVPALQQSAETAVEKIVGGSKSGSKEDAVKIEPACRELTLDVAWRQIIGLDLQSSEEIATFNKNVELWMVGITNFAYDMLPLWILKHTKVIKAKRVLEKQITEKIDNVEAKGVMDGSTLSAMVLATDDSEDGPSAKTKLTRQEVIDNIFLLIIAGSETSANTLTVAMLLLGMHPGVWQKLVREQEEVVAKYGTVLDKEQLDVKCTPYLDAVLKETMRLMPITGGGIRGVDETIVMDGVQIPKDWLVMYSIPLTHAQDPLTRKDDLSHMDPKLGFRPERWSDDATKPSSEFIPWGAGERFCLGHVLATAEMKVFLASLARRMKTFDLETDIDTVKWKEGIIRTPSDGVLIRPTKVVEPLASSVVNGLKASDVVPAVNA